MATQERRRAATQEQIRATVDGYVAAYMAADRDALLALFAPDAEWIDPVGTPMYRGREGVAAFWDSTRKLVDSIVLEPVHVHVCGNEAALVMEIHSVVRGVQLVIDAVDIFTFDDEARIQTGKAYWELEKARPASS
jgi:steroid Delta-isomerase